MNIISCIFCKCQLPSAGGTHDKYVEHLQEWHMMTVAEEVARAVQIASAPQEVSNSILINAEKVANSSASTSLPLPVSSSTDTTVTIQRSPAFSLSCQSSSNGEVDESSFENLSSIGGDGEAKKVGKKNLVKLARPRDAQSERTVTCTDCGIQLHWASLAQHRKKHHVKEESLESGTSNTEGGVNEGEGAGRESPMQSTSFEDEMDLGGERTEQKSELNTGRKKTVSCTQCGISLLNGSLNRHIKRFHPKQRPSGKVVTGDGQAAPSKKASEKWEVSPRLRVDQVFQPPEEGKVRCDECGKNFTTKDNLVFHMKTIHQGERLQCKVHGCEITFRGRESRDDHMRKEHGSPMLRCNFEGCTSEFYSRNGLRRHHGNHEV